MAKHYIGELEQMQSLSLESKIRMTQTRIKGWYEAFDGNVYVSVSGGKDSQVLAHIVKGMYPDVPCVFVNTGLEYDSVRKKGIELADEVLRPEMDFVNVIKNYGYPIFGKEISQAIFETRKKLEKRGVKSNYADALRNINENELTMREKQLLGILKDNNGEYSQYNKERYLYAIDAPFYIGNKCCDIMKKRPAHKYVNKTKSRPFIGTMADESRLRKTTWLKNGCNAFNAKYPQSTPLSFWTEQDILKYIKINNLDIANIYGDIAYQDDDGMYYDDPLFIENMQLTTTGAKRTGCVFCLFGITQNQDRLIQLKKAEPQKFDFVMRGGKFNDQGMWVPDNGLGYKFVIDWLNEHGDLNIKY
ncbi:MAG: phosphoadenosine phosphosulfate reductase family protein [Paludibacteraceae bacterium]|nr:phosphoadenosine phosphosulfate reductase family protein [Paludibacteraceae bacterium]